MARICPNCSNQMRLQNVHGIGLDVCPNCGGLWFDSDELRTLLAVEPQTFDELESITTAHLEQHIVGASHMVCPIDNIALDRYHYMYNTPVILHTCSKCGGFWVAGEDLKSMKALRAQVHTPLSPKEEAGIELAEATVAHEQEMAHQQHLLGFFSALHRYSPGWYGFIP